MIYINPVIKKNDKEHETLKVKSQNDPLWLIIYGQSIYEPESVLRKKWENKMVV